MIYRSSKCDVKWSVAWNVATTTPSQLSNNTR